MSHLVQFSANETYSSGPLIQLSIDPVIQTEKVTNSENYTKLKLHYLRSAYKYPSFVKNKGKQ